MTERPGESAAPWSRDAETEEPEPEWADLIRQRRKARGDRLRQIFETFSDDEDSAGQEGGEP